MIPICGYPSLDYDDIIITNGTAGSISGNGNTYTTTIFNTGTCVQSVYIRAGAITDQAGNTNAKSNTVTMTIDRTPPTVTFSPEPGGIAILPGSASATISSKITATDTGGSGLGTLQYALTAPGVTAEPTSWTTFTNGATISIAKCYAGDWNLWVKILDRAGNRCETKNVTYTVGEAVARIGSKYYTTLQEAIDTVLSSPSSPTVSISLLKSITENVKISSGKKIDLSASSSGLTITGSTTIQSSATVWASGITFDAATGTFYNSGSLYLYNCSMQSNSSSIYNYPGAVLDISNGLYSVSVGTMIRNYGTANLAASFVSTSGASVVLNYDTGIVYFNGDMKCSNIVFENQKGTVYLEGGSIAPRGGSTAGNFIKNVGGNVTISGSVNLEANSSSGPVIDNSASGTVPGVVTITGGTIKSTGYMAIRNSSTVNMQGGSVLSTTSSAFATIYNTGNLQISGGAVDSLTCSAVSNNSGGNVTISGTAKLTNNASGFATLKNITGCTLTMTGGSIVNANTTSNAIYNTGTAKVTGGTTKPKNYGV